VGRTFVTGATGFIGGALATRLQERGDELVTLARSDASAAKLGARGLRVARGDVLDEDSLAAAADYFYAKRRLGWTVSLFFGTVPVARDGRGLDHDSTAHIKALFANDWSLVMFAEGTRSRDGSVGKLRSGAAVLAAQHDLALVPIHVSGSHDVMPVGRYWPKFQPGFKRHPVEISFGPPIRPQGEEHRSEVMDRVREHLEQA
jgi:1-acyl-sn-glycerol-3-phosphate acyltransferase